MGADSHDGADERRFLAALFRSIALVGVGGVVGVVGYARYLGPWLRQLGATPAEARMSLPGDATVADPAEQATFATTVDAPPPIVWRRLTRTVGSAGGGVFARVRRFVTPADSDVALDVGETVPRPRDRFRVTYLDPERSVVLRTVGASSPRTLAFLIRPNERGSRVVVRHRWSRNGGRLQRARSRVRDDVSSAVEGRRILASIR